MKIHRKMENSFSWPFKVRRVDLGQKKGKNVLRMELKCYKTPLKGGCGISFSGNV